MPYQIGSIKISSGVIKDADLNIYKAFLDYPIKISAVGQNWNPVPSSTARLVTAKWFFQTTDGQGNWQTLQVVNPLSYDIKHNGVVDPQGNNNTFLSQNRQVIENTRALVNLELGKLFSNSYVGDIKITVVPGMMDSGLFAYIDSAAESIIINFQHPYVEGTDMSSNSNDGESGVVHYQPFYARITQLGTGENEVIIDKNWTEFTDYYNLVPKDVNAPAEQVESWQIVHKFQDTRDLLTYIHFGDDKVALVTNTREDKNTFNNYPYGTLLKLYEPLPDDIDETNNVYLVREIRPQKTEVVDLIPYDQEDEDLLVLRVPDSANVDSPITKRSTDLKSYEDLLTTDKDLQQI